MADELEPAVLMHGDDVPFSLGEWLSQLLAQFLGAANNGTPSRSYSDLAEDFRKWTNEPKVEPKPTPEPESDPESIFKPPSAPPVVVPDKKIVTIPQVLHDVAFRDVDTVLGYDVSHHQGSVDHVKFREAGYSIGICKATEGGVDKKGNGYVDPRFHENWKALKEAGLIHTAYHFARVSEKTSDGFKGIERDAVNEAKWFLMNYGDKIAPGMLPPVLDIEWDKRANAAGIKADDVLAFCIAFVQAVRDKLGVWPIVYTGPNFWRYKLKRSLALSKCPLWIVTSYKDNHIVTPKKEIPGWDWFMHQHSNSAKRPDDPKRGVDENYFRGPMADLRAMASIPEDAQGPKLRAA